MNAGSIRALLARDDLEQAATDLVAIARTHNAELVNEVIAHQAALTRANKDLRRGIIDNDDAERTRAKIRYALLDIVSELEDVPAAAAGGAPVFLSYNHADAAVAVRLRTALESAGVPVHIDVAAMQPGEDIRAFIARSIRDTRATICVISNRSIASGWVALETVLAFEAERAGGQRRFIACTLDADVLDAGYQLAKTREIDARIADIEALMREHAAARIDTQALNSEKSRLYALRANLDTILARLRESLTLPLDGQHFQPTVDSIMRALQSH
jgi:hypothetical protein